MGRRLRRAGALAAVLLCSAPDAARTQVRAPHAAGAGSPFAAVARARGLGAVAVNPAGLALPGGADRALLLPALSARLALSPIGLGDLADWSGRDVPRSVREAWLREVEAHGGERGRAHASLTWLALRRGRLGLRVGTTAAARARLNPEAAELLLFGNAGRTGTPRPLAASGSSLDGWVSTHAALMAASARPLEVGGVQGTLALGAALGVTVGHGLVLARDAGTRVDAPDPTVELAFPRLETEGALDPAGWGLDLALGAAWSGGPWSLGATLGDAVSTFRWSRASLRHRSGRGRLGGPAGEDPTGRTVPRPLLDALAAATPAPVLRLEAAHRLTPRLEAALATRHRLRGGLDAGPAGAVGASVAWSARRSVTVQGGAAYTVDGVLWSAGAALHRQAVEASLSLDADDGGVRGLSVGAGLPLGGSRR